jgi:Tfp pilus assembly protein PilF
LSTRFYVRSEDLLRGADGRVIRLATGPLDVAPRLYEGLIRFHQRDFAAADKLLRQVLDVDVGNALAYSLRALISLQHNALPAAKTSAERAVRAGRSVALAHYAFGAVLSRAGAMEQAQRELREAELLAPTVLATQVVLAEVEARSKDVSAARSRLVHVLRVDPTYLSAKRALFSLER